MYFGKDLKPEKSRKVYLPAGSDWYDLYTDERFEGGTWIDADAPLDRIPVFVKAGSVIPRTEAALSVSELKDEYTLHVYPGLDARFTLYVDDGDGYDYEQGAYTLTEYCWDDHNNKLFENGLDVTGKALIHG